MLERFLSALAKLYYNVALNVWDVIVLLIATVLFFGAVAVLVLFLEHLVENGSKKS